ncbi:MAG: IS3 family transposase [Chloroflexota bacterium]
MIDQLRSHGPELPVTRACALLGLARSDYYRQRVEAAPPPGLLDALDALGLEFSGSGYRRVTAQLRREGWEVNHKRVLRLMREAGRLCRQKRRWSRTTDSRHGLQVYPNLLPDRGWRTLTAPNQAWVADLTYIRLPGEFCSLAAVLDAFSRKGVGWSLSRSLEAGGVLTALERALADRTPGEGWIHHSDRGVQYACRDYVERLQRAGARISMTAPGSPRENAQAESFFRTLKREAVYVADYRNFGEAEGGIAHFIEEGSDRKRLHSALGYLPPIEFEKRFAAGLPH